MECILLGFSTDDDNTKYHKVRDVIILENIEELLIIFII